MPEQIFGRQRFNTFQITGMFMDLNAWQRSVSNMVDTSCFSTIFVDGNHKRTNQNVPFTCFACRVHNQSLFVHSSHVTSANVLILLGSPKKVNAAASSLKWRMWVRVSPRSLSSECRRQILQLAVVIANQPIHWPAAAQLGRPIHWLHSQDIVPRFFLSLHLVFR